MQKNLTPIVILFILLAGAGYYWFNTRTVETKGPQTLQESMGEAAEFARAMESGQPTSCVITKDSTQMEYHLKDKLMAVDITTTVDGEAVLSHMVNDQQYLYTWIEGQTQGSKMRIPTEDEIKTMAEDISQSETTAPNFGTEADYSSLQEEGYNITCMPGLFSDDVFTPPNSIKFFDPSEMMQILPTTESNGQIDMSKLKELQKQYGGE